MNNNKILSIIFIVIFCCFSQVFSQNSHQTPYQKKKLELTKKWYKILTGKTISMTDEMVFDQQLRNKEDQDFLLSLAVFDYASKHSKSQCEKIFAQIKVEFKQAEKLKNAIDFQREKEIKLKKDREEKEIKNKKEQEEQEANYKREQEEKSQKLRDSIEKYEKSDRAIIANKIISEFKEWNQKGEFEKESDYVERLKNASQITFEAICLNQIKYRIYLKNSANWNEELSTYDSEGELFKVSFAMNDVEWECEINIPIAQAQAFKNNWSDLSLRINDYNWCFVENNLCPTLVTMQNNHEKVKFDFLSTLKNQLEILYSFDGLEIENPYLKGYVFKYSEAKVIEKELIRLDSLDLIMKNKKLDSIFNLYNQKLLLNPYNSSKKIMSKYQKVLKTDNKREYSFNNSLNSIQSQFEKMSRNFEIELKNQNPSEYCIIYFYQNPEKRTEADKKYLECRCDFENRTDFDIQFIQGKVYDCNCREKEFQENGSLFLNKEEFDNFYNQGHTILIKEIETRILIKEEEEAFVLIKSKISIIKTIDLKGSKNSIAKKEDDLIAKSFIDFISEYSVKPYYSSIIDFLIENNKGLKKEWSKKGEFFESKIEFFEAFISKEYRVILKDKKAKKHD